MERKISLFHEIHYIGQNVYHEVTKKRIICPFSLHIPQYCKDEVTCNLSSVTPCTATLGMAWPMPGCIHAAVS
jgi:hypothetical protein